MTGALATVAATTAAGRWSSTATAAGHRVDPARGGHYSPNAAPLHPTAFLRLPPGRVTARGWLAGQLKLQLDGLCGRYEEFSHFLDFTATGWVRPDLGGWEEVPYWLRGYTDLAIVTGDATALAAVRRWFDAILAHRTGDAFLLDLADKIHAYGADWGDNLVDAHNVNIAQGFREPAQYALRSGSAQGTRDTYGTYGRAMDQYGQFPGGGFAGDENARPGHDDPRQGFETCGIVEFMASHQLLTRITGDPLWADRCEELAFNSLPASLDPSGKAVHYITSANGVDLDDVPKSRRQFQNGFAMQAFLPGVDQYRCCPHNYGMGWPYFTEELWFATPDGGLAAAMYAACEVTAKVADGTEVTFTEETGYPFTETVTLTLKAPKPLGFPLVLRVPAWCEAPEIAVNGQGVDAPAGPAFTRIDRTWADGERVTLRFPLRATVRTWEHNRGSVSVDRGPLTYSLRIGERYERIGGTDRFPQYAVHATGPWNYGLVLDAEDPAASLRPRTVRRLGDDNPFTLDGTPLTITAKARRIPEWTADDERVVAPLQDSPARSGEPVQEVTLVPMGGGEAAHHVVPHRRPGRAALARRPLVPRPQPALRQGARRGRDVHRRQRPRRAVRRQRHRRPPLAARLIPGAPRTPPMPLPSPGAQPNQGDEPVSRLREPGRRPWWRRTIATTGLLALVSSALVGVGAAPAGAASWSPKAPPMTTPWTAQVPVDKPLPEYPRPQLTRPDWSNLNGIWDFAVTGRDAGQPDSFPDRIRVPFVAESALSGIQRRITENDKLWYKRAFTVPSDWDGRRVELNFGASDWQTTVWANGTQVGAHKGGYDSFAYDITPQLNGGTNTVVVSVYDPTQTGGQAVGKQRVNDVQPHDGGGIFYTAASGIWQTVWLEPVAEAHITRLDMTPDLDDSTLRVTVRAASAAGRTARVTVSSGGTVVGTATGPAGSAFAVPVPDPRLWSPDDPFLYDVKADLLDGTAVTDSVGSYTGMRSIAVAKVDNVMRPVLNGEFVFQTGTLDQGYWPDGIYTAPTDDALKSDLQAHKDLGFNMVRKHIKVEPQRWFYWADKLGLLVWQDMPAMDTGKSPDGVARTQWESEFHAVIDQHRSSPSLVMWVDQNEGWGQYDQARIADEVKAYDPTRLVDNMSGVNCCGSVDGGNGDVIDNHVYVGPGNTAPTATRAAVLGEFGGLGYKVPGHEWFPGGGFSYEDQPSVSALNDRFVGLIDAIRVGQLPAGLSASVYTEITDVENEANGLLTYDRQVVKVDAARVRAANRALVDASRNPAPPVALPTGQYESLRVTTPGYTDRYLRHQDSLAFTEVVGDDSGALLKNDATWKIVPGLANGNCYSFESRNYPGEYLRHRDFRVRREANDGSALYRADATWCAVAGTGGVRLTSANLPGSYLRHIESEVWLATPGGGHTWDNPATFTEDTTWAVEAPWAP